MSTPSNRAQEIAGRLRELKKRGEQVLSSHKPNPPNVIGFPTLDSGLFAGWRTQCLTYLQGVFGADHTYPTSFAEATDQHGHTSEAKRGMAILEAAAEDVESGYLARVEDLGRERPAFYESGIDACALKTKPGPIRKLSIPWGSERREATARRGWAVRGLMLSRVRLPRRNSRFGCLGFASPDMRE
jgi:hypothetical protein